MWKIRKRNPKSLNKKTKFLRADYNANYKNGNKEILKSEPASEGGRNEQQKQNKCKI